MDGFEAQLKNVYIIVERYVKYRLNRGQDAEDLLQDICLTAYLKYDQLEKKSSFKAWILSIARNRCNDYFRMKGNSREVTIGDLLETKLVYSRNGWIISTLVEDTMALLTERDREILRMFYWQQLSQREIAQKLNIPVGTVKSRLNTARNHFKQKYPCQPKGEDIMTKLPKIMPNYEIEKQEAQPFSVKWEELLGWLIIPKEGENVQWGMYDFPERKRTEYTEVKVVGKAEVHGIEGVEIIGIQYGAGDVHSTGCMDGEERRFVAQLTDTHSRYLAETHMENGVRKCYTFLDGNEFLDNWGFGEDNCGNETALAPKGLLKREGNMVTTLETREVLDVVGRYTIKINQNLYDTVCVMDVELYNEAVAVEQYIDRNGRTILWRRFNRDDWAIDRFGGKLWSEKLPDNERLYINGETYVHWYDCITDYIL